MHAPAPSGKTGNGKTSNGKTSNGKNRQRQEQATARTGNGENARLSMAGR
jgi:hypothetical protein